MNNQIFVFGSNLKGIHGAGTALYARQHLGAIIGIGEGPTGYCYAIPTKDENMNIRSLEEIKISVDRFISYANNNFTKLFYLTRIGCGLSKYKDCQIAPLFFNIPDNCIIPLLWKDYIPNFNGEFHNRV